MRGIFNLLCAAGLAAASMAGASGAALAQGEPATCISELQTEYGDAAGLSSDCASETDCTFQAPSGNASARALIATIAERAEACFTSAGLNRKSEQTQGIGTTTTFNGEGEGQCAILVSAPSGSPPEGVRVLCRPE